VADASYLSHHPCDPCFCLGDFHLHRTARSHAGHIAAAISLPTRRPLLLSIRRTSACRAARWQTPRSVCSASVAETLQIDPCRRYHGPVTTKERLHKLVDELSEQEAEAALVIVERRRDDPMLHALASAPLDDEASEADEDASAAEALAAYRRGEAVSSEQLRAELDLD
jgi:hypothetical protein